MSVLIRLVFFLTGALTGKTIKLGDYSFLDGKCEVTSTHDQMPLHARFLERNWSAFAENDPRLKEAQANVLNQVHEDGNGPSGSSEVHGSNLESGNPPEVVGNPDSGEPPADPSTGNSEPNANQSDRPPQVVKLEAAIRMLDPANDLHWTATGLPTMAAVEKFFGSAGITRADVAGALPGFNREQAQAALDPK